MQQSKETFAGLSGWRVALTGHWSDKHVSIGQHLEICEGCREELQAYRAMSSIMSKVQRPVPPKDLALKIRVAAAQRLSDRTWMHYALRAAHSRRTGSEEYPGTVGHSRHGRFHGGLRRVRHRLPVAGPGRAVARRTNDSPTNLIQPARLEALAPFPITGLEESGHSGPHALLVEATVNSEGEAVSYRIISGPDNDTVRRQLDLVLLFSRFRPEMSFGRFTSGGHVVLSFSDISIRG